jgi:hypothetical protein
VPPHIKHAVLGETPHLRRKILKNAVTKFSVSNRKHPSPLTCTQAYELVISSGNLEISVETMSDFKIVFVLNSHGIPLMSTLNVA